MRNASVGLLAVVVLLGVVGCGPEHVARVNCGAEKLYFDTGNARWLPDQVLEGDARWGAVGGKTIERTGMTIAATDQQRLYLTERYGMEAYQFNVENGTYLLRLHFAETYSGITGPGQRVFTVKVNGWEAVKDLDVWKESGGSAKPLIKGIDGVKVTDGKLRIEFAAKVQNAEINAIEVLKY